jgi:hypothetical protein
VARGADLLVVEATLTSAKLDDPRRGHLTPEEAVEMAVRAGVPRAVLVHFRADLRHRVDAACSRLTGAIGGHPGLVIDIEASAPRPLADATDAVHEDLAADDASITGRVSEGIARAHLP